MTTDWAWLEEIEARGYEDGTENDLFQAVMVDMTKMVKCIHTLRAGLERINNEPFPGVTMAQIVQMDQIIARETLSKAARGEFE
jgi:hypothetical protein